MASDPDVSAKSTPPGLARRLAAIAYDALLLTAVLFVATAALLPFTGGDAVRADHGWYSAYLAAVSFGYFGWFWTHGGETLGMRSWRLRLVGAGTNGASWRQSLVRFLGACLSGIAFGAGFFWMLVDPKRLMWHDRISGTRIVDVS